MKVGQVGQVGQVGRVGQGWQVGRAIVLVAAIGASGCTAPTPEAPVPTSLEFIQRAPRVATTRTPPLLILLHGRGADERDLLPVADGLDPRLAVVSPRAPLRMREGMYAWFWDGERGTELEQSRQSVVALIDRAVSATGADPRRVFLAGFSQGAMVTLAVALTAPEKIAGGIVLSGQLFPSIMTRHAPDEALRGFPLLVIHGTDDQVVPVRFGREASSAAKGLAMHVEYYEFPAGHSIEPETIDALNTWLRQRLDGEP